MGKAGQLLICMLPLGIALLGAAWSRHEKREKINYNRDQSVLDAQADAAKARAEADKAMADAIKLKAELEKEKALWRQTHQDTLDLSSRRN
jgi:hypothetical protein